jgi:hypothetical protein
VTKFLVGRSPEGPQIIMELVHFSRLVFPGT